VGISIRKVAQKAHVSISTVSRALNSSGYVSKETLEKVVAKVPQLVKDKRLVNALKQYIGKFERR
jgi:transcriptional regulator with XRE-family HTH domain